MIKNAKKIILKWLACKITKIAVMSLAYDDGAILYTSMKRLCK